MNTETRTGAVRKAAPKGARRGRKPHVAPVAATAAPMGAAPAPEAADDAFAETPHRGRPPRAQEVQAERRRRKDSTLDMGGVLNLDCAADHLDQNYVYRFVNDDNDRIRALTVRDDYDFVEAPDLRGAFEHDAEDSSSRIRKRAGTDKYGNPVYAYLLRKPKELHEIDYQRIVAQREDMMAGIVTPTDEPDTTTTANFNLPEHGYVPKGNRAGPVRRRAA